MDITIPLHFKNILYVCVKFIWRKFNKTKKVIIFVLLLSHKTKNNGSKY